MAAAHTDMTEPISPTIQRIVEAASCVLLVQGRSFAAGAAMGFASLIKPQFIPLVLVAAVLRRWRFAAGLMLVAVTLGIVSLRRYG